MSSTAAWTERSPRRGAVSAPRAPRRGSTVVAEATILASVFELAANLGIVTAIGLAVPQAIRLRANERIQP